MKHTKTLFKQGDIVWLPQRHQTFGGWFGEAVIMRDVFGFDDVVWLCPVGGDQEDEANWKLVCADQVQRRRQGAASE